MAPTLKKTLLGIVALVVVLAACTHETNDVIAPVVPEPSGNDTSPVVFDPALVPYATLSQYNFFQGAMVDQVPVVGVLPYDVITPLFSDYAHKKRFVWMPNGQQATYVSDNKALSFPDGTVLIKTFYFDRVQPADTRRIMETRLLFRRNGQWEFADYVWNAAQTEAYFNLNGQFVPLAWKDDADVTHTLNYRIPAGAECHTCHKDFGIDSPIGPKPQNLDRDFDYPEGTSNQLVKWATVGYLQPGFPSNIDRTVRWDDPDESLTDRVRAYVDMNCSHCHNEGGHCDYRPMRFAWSETTDLVNLGVCVEPEDPIDPNYPYIVASGNVPRSMLWYRISSTAEEVRMPLLGRTVVHEEAKALLEEWINTLSPPCP